MKLNSIAIKELKNFRNYAKFQELMGYCLNIEITNAKYNYLADLSLINYLEQGFQLLLDQDIKMSFEVFRKGIEKFYSRE